MSRTHKEKGPFHMLGSASQTNRAPEAQSQTPVSTSTSTRLFGLAKPKEKKEKKKKGKGSRSQPEGKSRTRSPSGRATPVGFSSTGGVKKRCLPFRRVEADPHTSHQTHWFCPQRAVGTYTET